MSDETPQEATAAVEASPEITQAQPLDLTGGHADGEELLDLLGNTTGEIVVHEKDAEGNVTGWHKAPASTEGAA